MLLETLFFLYFSCRAILATEVICAADGLMADPTDCHKFINCANGIAFSQSCPPTLQWNSQNNYCDYPENVDCQSGAAPTEAPASTDAPTVAPTPTPTQDPVPVPVVTSEANNDVQSNSTAESSNNNDGKKVVCYYTNWSTYRQGSGKFEPADIDPELCTHIIYSFTKLNSLTLEMDVFDPWIDIDNKFYEKVSIAKKLFSTF